MRRISLLGSLVLLLTAVACDPIVMVPGGALSGSVAEPPSDWDFTQDVETVQLETNPEDPYSVNVWGVGVGPHFYVAGSQKSQWTKNARADSRVRLRVEGVLYEMSATPSEREAEREAYLTAAQAKYDFEPTPEQRETSVVFRLDPR